MTSLELGLRIRNTASSSAPVAQNWPVFNPAIGPGPRGFYDPRTNAVVEPFVVLDTQTSFNNVLNMTVEAPPEFTLNRMTISLGSRNFRRVGPSSNTPGWIVWSVSFGGRPISSSRRRTIGSMLIDWSRS